MSSDRQPLYESPWGINAVALLKALTKETLPIYEQVVVLARQKLSPVAEKMEEDKTRAEETAAILRTGGLFVFDCEDIPGTADLDRPDSHLPPLPFPRTWVEIEGIPWIFFDSDDTRNMVLGWALSEIKQGVEWNIKMPMIDFDTYADNYDVPLLANTRFPTDALTTREYNLLYDEELEQVILTYGPDDHADMERMKDNIELRHQYNGTCFLPERLVQMLHVLGAKHEERVFPRPVRRDFTRATGFMFPQLYFVSLRGSGESNTENGPGDRVYHHRWLVRGHYRKHERGEFMLPHKGPCTWVKPYVKGPHGAPWKGRGVYRSKGEEDDV